MPGIETAFKGLVPTDYDQVQEGRLSINYDTRDSQVTTTKGAFFQAYSGYSVKGLASVYNYDRYGLEGRYYYPWKSNPNNVLAFQIQGQQLLGSAPFWLLPELGGKYSLRAYGYGRYIDNGMFSANVEQRFDIYQAKVAGVETEIEIAPFTGVGSVFPDPADVQYKYLRPVVGTAIRAIVRPQVVGSLDFGVGQEGLAAFMDINYAF
jgi:outer membrane protein assembly factor BamA